MKIEKINIGENNINFKVGINGHVNDSEEDNIYKLPENVNNLIIPFIEVFIVSKSKEDICNNNYLLKILNKFKDSKSPMVEDYVEEYGVLYEDTKLSSPFSEYNRDSFYSEIVITFESVKYTLDFSDIDEIIIEDYFNGGNKLYNKIKEVLNSLKKL